VRRIVFVSVH